MCILQTVSFRFGSIDVCVDEDVAYVEIVDEALVRAQNIDKRLSNLRLDFEDGNMMFHLRASCITKYLGFYTMINCGLH